MFSSVIYLKLILDMILGRKILPPPLYRESNFPSTFYLIFFFFLILATPMACGTLVPQPDIEPMPRMLEG